MYKAAQTRMIVLINKSILQIKLATQEKMICLECILRHTAAVGAVVQRPLCGLSSGRN